jgi:hypothetical protein
LAPGDYNITLLTPCCQPGQCSLGTLTDSNGNLVTTGNGTMTAGSFSGIQIDDGTTGSNYNFADLAYPITLLSKRMLLNSSDPIIHTIPELGSFVLLVMASLTCAGFAWRRRAEPRP